MSVDKARTFPGTHFDALVALADGDFSVPPTDPDEPALVHFTSDTTGASKGAIHATRLSSPTTSRRVRARPLDLHRPTGTGASALRSAAPGHR
ncbi:hypothetical protein [Streptomyces sp. NBC_01549]|uniref:hypothetical protein n=1 Tax=Streptomyces sp. NBC_01549 TaxID=2975874 RepID=UPI0022509AE0|nr:hypothetical protein [Streptomyces sp. NBC_01549]